MDLKNIRRGKSIMRESHITSLGPKAKCEHVDWVFLMFLLFSENNFTYFEAIIKKCCQILSRSRPCGMFILKTYLTAGLIRGHLLRGLVGLHHHFTNGTNEIIIFWRRICQHSVTHILCGSTWLQIIKKRI